MPVENDPRPLTGIERDLADRRSMSELIDTALAEAELDDGELPSATQALSCLLARGDREGFEAACALSRSDDPKKRDLAATIFGQLGTLERTFPEECCDALLDLLARETNSQVFVTTVFAFGHLGNPRAEPALIALRRHSNDVVRYGVAFSLAGTESPEGVSALLELMEDAYDMARDWATTSISGTLSIDGPNIREALLKRIEDEDEITRAEALNGLAQRNDGRVLPYLIAELKTLSFEHGHLFENAAKTFLGFSEDVELDSEALIDLLLSHSATC